MCKWQQGRDKPIWIARSAGSVSGCGIFTSAGFSRRLFSTSALTRLLNASGFFRISTDASMFAGDEKLGADRMEMTERMMVAIERVGSHRSDASSPLISSGPGGCRMLMHTFPFVYTVGDDRGQEWMTRVWKRT